MNPRPPFDPITIIDLAAQRARLGDAIEHAIARVLAHHQFILDPEVARLKGRSRDFVARVTSYPAVMPSMRWRAAPRPSIMGQNRRIFRHGCLVESSAGRALLVRGPRRPRPSCGGGLRVVGTVMNARTAAEQSSSN
jgi:hypothetical protein